MAYATPIGVRCPEPGCRKPVEYIVKNCRNEEVGKRCLEHADRLVRLVSANEDAERARRAAQP